MKRMVFASIALVALIAFTVPVVYAADDPAPTNQHLNQRLVVKPMLKCFKSILP